MRHIEGIGNNLNHVARRVNSGELGAVERVQVIAVLMSMERSLQARSVPSTEVK
ncbi:plasmid mobilization relaxosome protein MobC [Aeromonas veronii]|uniref:plasmid mobilization relaxosome protein MobC n=1 Tax=Aeromonas veronii TaxID=654 RepID=UPI0038B483DE